MSNFGKINKIYNEFLDLSKYGPLPPSRACVGSKCLPEDCHVQLSVVVDVKNTGKEKINKNKGGLHVQGRSYWAPCNIGPYSQSTWLNDDANQVSFISGQIGLVPQSMEILGTPLTDQIVLALQHFDTLCETIGAQEKLLMTCYISDESVLDSVIKTWAFYCSNMNHRSDLWMDKSDDVEKCLVLVKISELPRGAVAEFGGVTCKRLIVDDNDSDTRKKGKRMMMFQPAFGYNRNFITGFVDSREELELILEKTPKSAQITLYYNPKEIITFHHHIGYYPVEKLFDYRGKEHRFGLHIRS
ncbi:CBM_collapsed_G0039070.mRNA.1.CDS.1 [Saccharomyces cerevisiae]|nr:CBM_collapsed_G0039070.mRNA.1.CDS.1 [Saccharomyces cerevisiae]